LAALTKLEKIFVVERLAMWEEPSEIALAFKEHFGKEIDRRQVWVYNASKPQLAERMSAEMVALFHEVRKRFREETIDIPIANKAYRLRELQKQLERAKGRKFVNEKQLAEALEQAAKEEGGYYTNKRELSGPEGTPLRFPQVVLYLPDNGRDDHSAPAGTPDPVLDDAG
jgi:hypothetical protein